MGSFLLLYPYKDDNEPFNIDKYFQYKRRSRAARGSSSVNPNTKKLYKLRSAKPCKSRLCPKNLLLESAGLFHQWLLHTATIVEDPQLAFLEKDQTQCIT